MNALAVRLYLDGRQTRDFTYPCGETVTARRLSAPAGAPPEMALSAPLAVPLCSCPMRGMH